MFRQKARSATKSLPRNTLYLSRKKNRIAVAWIFHPRMKFLPFVDREQLDRRGHSKHQEWCIQRGSRLCHVAIPQPSTQAFSRSLDSTCREMW